MARQRVMASVDGYVDRNLPDQVRNTHGIFAGGQLGGSGNRCLAFVWAQLPVPAGAQVTAARLYLTVRQDNPGPAPVTVRVLRVVDTWAEASLTWQTRPAILAENEATFSTSRLSAGDVWTVDVTRLVQDAVNGVPAGRQWGGFRVSTDSESAVLLHSSESTTPGARPALEVEWSEAPLPPANLSPAGGAIAVDKPIFSCHFRDVAGDTTLSAMQVRTFETWTRANGNYGWVWDSGIVETTDPELNSEAAGYPGARLGPDMTWWRVRVRDGDGLWSDWSPYESFSYQPLPGLQITYPVGPEITDPTPAVRWNFDGSQRALNVRVLDLSTGETVYETRQRISLATSHGIPDGVMAHVGRRYRIWVEVWDQIDRTVSVGTTNRSRDYVDVELAPVTPGTTADVRVEQRGVSPIVDIHWATTDVPDSFVVIRDGYVLKTGKPEEFGTFPSYSWRDAVSGYSDHTWTVRAIRDGGTWDGTTVRTDLHTEGIWLIDPSWTLSPVVLAGTSDGNLSLGEVSARHEPLDSPSTVLVTQNQRGLEGALEGDILHRSALAPDVTARDMYDRLMAFRNHPGSPWWLIFASYSMTVTIDHVDARATPAPAEEKNAVQYHASFNFGQSRGPYNGGY